jgi:hypothetical protein
MSRPNRISDEELSMVKSAVMFPIILDTLEYDIAKMKVSGLKMQAIHVAHLKMLQNNVIEDIKIVKKELRNRGIKIYEEGKTATGYQAKYICRGYKNEMSWLSSHIRSIVIIRLAEMLEIPIQDCGE